MHKGRLEAFSDGVFAIIITIMVLELQAPKDTHLPALIVMWPQFLGYALSFLYVGIYWNNHHHLFQAVQHIRGAVLWANLHLLFWLSLFPLATRWLGLGERKDPDIGEYHLSTVPVVVYGGVLMMAGIAYYILV